MLTLKRATSGTGEEGRMWMVPVMCYVSHKKEYPLPYHLILRKATHIQSSLLLWTICCSVLWNFPCFLPINFTIFFFFPPISISFSFKKKYICKKNHFILQSQLHYQDKTGVIS